MPFFYLLFSSIWFCRKLRCLIHPYHCFILFCVHPLIVAVYLLTWISSRCASLSLSLTTCPVLVDSLQFLLIFYEMVVVLLVDRVILCSLTFHYTPFYCYFTFFFLLFHYDLLKFLLNSPSSYLFCTATLFLPAAGNLSPVRTWIRSRASAAGRSITTEASSFSRFFEFSAHVLKGEVACFEFIQQLVGVVYPECPVADYTILLLSSLISTLYSCLSFSTWWCRP